MKHTASHGHLSSPQTYHVHEGFTCATAFDALLRFRDRRLETAYWRHVGDWLCNFDILGSLAIMAAVMFMRWQMVHATAPGSPLDAACTAAALLFLVSQTLIMWLAVCRSAEYRRQRDAVLAAMCLVRYLILAGLTFIAARSHPVQDTHTAKDFGESRRSACGYLELAMSLAHRGLIFWTSFLSALRPLRFSLHAPLHTLCALPLLLHAAGCLAQGALAAPPLREPVCVVASGLSLRPYRADDCHPQAPQIVAYSVRGVGCLRCVACLRIRKV